jgi:hypothetical protein
MGAKWVPDTKTNWPDVRRSQNQLDLILDNLGDPVPGGYKYGDVAIQVWGSLKFDSDSRMTALSRPSNNSKLQTHPFFREGVPLQRARNCLTVIKMWTAWVPDTKTDRLTAHQS